MSPTTNSDMAGVQQLIDRLKADGVEEGKQQAAAMISEAKHQAAAILEEARGQADAIIRESEQDADRIETNGKRALSLASRDTGLRLKEQLEREFRGWISGLVKEQLSSPEFLGEILREMATQTAGTVGGNARGQADSGAGKLMVLTATEHASTLEKFVKSQATAMFRSGIEIRPDTSVGHGFRMKMEANEVEIDFTDEAVTAALMRYLAPKFRQLIGSQTAGSTDG